MKIELLLPTINFTIDVAFLFKIAIAIFVGHLIGRERKKQYKPGGSRTFSLVCLGATLLTVLALQLNEHEYYFDFTRLLAYGLVSLGFATSGIIRIYQDKVQGLTTASTIWITTIIGYFIGMGYYNFAVVSSIFIYAILESKYKKVSKKKKR